MHDGFRRHQSAGDIIQLLQFRAGRLFLGEDCLRGGIFEVYPFQRKLNCRSGRVVHLAESFWLLNRFICLVH